MGVTVRGPVDAEFTAYAQTLYLPDGTPTPAADDVDDRALDQADEALARDLRAVRARTQLSVVNVALLSLLVWGVSGHAWAGAATVVALWLLLRKAPGQARSAAHQRRRVALRVHDAQMDWARTWAMASEKERTAARRKVAVRRGAVAAGAAAAQVGLQAFSVATSPLGKLFLPGS